jgi:hypothetical protein
MVLSAACPTFFSPLDLSLMRTLTCLIPLGRHFLARLNYRRLISVSAATSILSDPTGALHIQEVDLQSTLGLEQLWHGCKTHKGELLRSVTVRLFNLIPTRGPVTPNVMDLRALRYLLRYAQRITTFRYDTSYSLARSLMHTIRCTRINAAFLHRDIRRMSQLRAFETTAYEGLGRNVARFRLESLTVHILYSFETCQYQEVLHDLPCLRSLRLILAYRKAPGSVQLHVNLTSMRSLELVTLSGFGYTDRVFFRGRSESLRRLDIRESVIRDPFLLSPLFHGTETLYLSHVAV